MVYKRAREEKLQKRALEAANKPDEECTFTPTMYTTAKKADQPKARDLNRFLSD
jgi:hypothetical protein